MLTYGLVCSLPKYISRSTCLGNYSVSLKITPTFVPILIQFDPLHCKLSVKYFIQSFLLCVDKN